MRTRKFGAQPFTGLQLVWLDHHPAVSPASPGKPRQGAFIFIDDDCRTSGLGRDLTLTQNKMLRAKAADLWVLRLRRRLFDLMFYGHQHTSNSKPTRIIYL